jgi:hypothetical protein
MGYGTVFKFKVKSGHEADLLSVWDEWERDMQPKVKGAGAGYLYKLDNEPGTFIGVAVFDTKEDYFANADNPEQDKWFQRIREHLEADPEWNDGEIVRSS